MKLQHYLLIGISIGSLISFTLTQINVFLHHDVSAASVVATLGAYIVIRDLVGG